LFNLKQKIDYQPIRPLIRISTYQSDAYLDDRVDILARETRITQLG